MIKRLAIIPARSGSKRIKNKNIMDFCGSPMFTHIAISAKDSSLFDEIHISTESQEIADLAEDYGFQPSFLRPKDLSDDHTPLIDVIHSVYDTYQKKNREFDEVWLLMATSVLLTSKDLIKVADFVQKDSKALPVLGISEFPVPIEWAFSISKSGKLDPVQEGGMNVRSQDLKKKYYDAGQFCVFPGSYLNNFKAGDHINFSGYILPKYKSVDIDEVEDLVLAEAIFKMIRK